MAFNSGEYIDKFILPTIIHTLRNEKMDFMSVIPTAPQRSITAAGIIVHKIGQPIEVDWNKSDDYVDGDIKAFDVENDTLAWDYLSTTPFSTDKEEIRTSALNRQGILRQKSLEAISESWRDKTLHNIAPADGTISEMPILETTGPDRGDGTKRMLISDLIRWQEALRKLNLRKGQQIYVVLSVEHLTDLLIDALNYQNFKDIYAKTAKGEAINQYGFGFFWNNKTIMYNAANVKLADGAVPIATDRIASIAFYAPHTTKAFYNLTSHFKPMSENTRSNPPTDEMRYTGNALGSKIYNYGHSAMKSGTV